MNQDIENLQVDNLDRMLSDLPGDEIPAFMVPAILQVIERKRQKRERVRLGLGSFLTAAGAALVYPIVPGLLTEFAPPESGLTVTLTMLDQALAGIEIWFGSMNQALSGLQAAFYGNLDPLAWIGLASLASGCAMTLGALQPHNDLDHRKSI